ncbi:hypothetical protein VNO80_26657 [Phaseolus coccineus]|uniref:Uncharacterized protein n=1 Tax=Phaseolus coccineus TaxID=3886 RepID=A0AAN9LFF0_PHACN
MLKQQDHAEIPAFIDHLQVNSVGPTHPIQIALSNFVEAVEKFVVPFAKPNLICDQGRLSPAHVPEGEESSVANGLQVSNLKEGVLGVQKMEEAVMCASPVSCAMGGEHGDGRHVTQSLLQEGQLNFMSPNGKTDDQSSHPMEGHQANVINGGGGVFKGTVTDGNEDIV